MIPPARHLDLCKAKRRLRATRVVAAVSTVAGLGCLAAGVLPDGAGALAGTAAVARPDAATASVQPGGTGPTAPSSPDRRLTGSPAARPPTGHSSRPAALAIPAIGVTTALGSLGLQDDRTVEVPADPDRAGWYRFGARPGSTGAAVILGHVDSVDGPAVFARLGSLRRGDLVTVDLEDGRRLEFEVSGVRTYPNAAFPASRVYRSRNGHHDLNLVTCGGAYDRDNGGYQANVVVYTQQVRHPGRPAGGNTP